MTTMDSLVIFKLKNKKNVIEDLYKQKQWEKGAKEIVLIVA